MRNSSRRKKKKTKVSSLKDKRILHGITGSIAAYRALDIIRKVVSEGATVRAVMTGASRNFITPLSVEISCGGGKVPAGLFEDPMAHINLTRDADLMLVAPATANIIGKFANGIADDLLSTCLLSFRGKAVIAPAMNWRMYENPVLQRNLGYLRASGVVEVAPEEGPLACGEEGVGRMAEVETVLEAVKTALAVKDLAGERIVVTAGPTREYMDTVRFISNRSTGKMGYALARVASRRGAAVTLISGPSALKPPPAVRFLAVETAHEMKEAVAAELDNATVLVMAAAVTDFSPTETSTRKLDKAGIDSIRLQKTPDILAGVGHMKKKPLLIGFAADEGDRFKKAIEKRLAKGADIMVFNDISMPGSGFGADTNRIVIIERDGMDEYPLLDKEDAAGLVLDRIVKHRA